MPPADGEAGMEFDGIEIEWDEAKRLSNMAKHGLDFVDGLGVWRGRAWTRPSHYRQEERFISTGISEGRVLVVIWTLRGTRRRLISVRVARRDEREDYTRFLEGCGEAHKPH
jgi:hypothetical protein